MQTSYLRLMGKKLLVALTMEGKFAGEGLQSIDEDDDMLSAMARELVERNGIGETADAIWRAINTEHQNRFLASGHSSDGAGSVEAPDAPVDTQPEAPNIVAEVVDRSPIFIFGQRPEALSGRRKRARPPVPEQPSLFGLS